MMTHSAQVRRGPGKRVAALPARDRRNAVIVEHGREVAAGCAFQKRSRNASGRGAHAAFCKPRPGKR